MYPTVLSHLAELLDRPLVLLPPVGWIRHDDLPGDAHIQLAGAAKPDRKIRAHVQRMTRAFQNGGAKINLAISARGLVEGEEAPLDEIWPSATEAIADGIGQGVIEPVCHGYLHLDTARLERGELDPREYRELDPAEAAGASRRPWNGNTGRLARRPRRSSPPTGATDPGFSRRGHGPGLAAWLPPLPGPLAADGGVHESLLSTLEGLHALDYKPLARLAAAGVPPMIVIHGGLFDGRIKVLGLPGDAGTMARLAVRRDLLRVPSIPGVRWVGAPARCARSRRTPSAWDGSASSWGESGAVLVEAGGRTVLGDLAGATPPCSNWGSCVTNLWYKPPYSGGSKTPESAYCVSGSGGQLSPLACAGGQRLGKEAGHASQARAQPGGWAVGPQGNWRSHADSGSGRSYEDGCWTPAAVLACSGRRRPIRFVSCPAMTRRLLTSHKTAPRQTFARRALGLGAVLALSGRCR